MFKSSIQRSWRMSSVISRSSRLSPPQNSFQARRFSHSPYLCQDSSDPLKSSAEDRGKYARTDENVRVEYPKDEELPPTPVVQGRGGRHFKRTLPTFSLEDRVSLITGGARGLGLVMGQGLVASGSNLAIADLNGEFFSSVFFPLDGVWLLGTIYEANALYRGRSAGSGGSVVKTV